VTPNRLCPRTRLRRLTRAATVARCRAELRRSNGDSPGVVNPPAADWVAASRRGGTVTSNLDRQRGHARTKCGQCVENRSGVDYFQTIGYFSAHKMGRADELTPHRLHISHPRPLRIERPMSRQKCSRCREFGNDEFFERLSVSASQRLSVSASQRLSVSASQRLVRIAP